MALEIERKYLVRLEAWRPPKSGGTIQRQGYLSVDAARVVRVRRAGRRAWLTVKGQNRGIARTEFEYPIPVADAEAMLETLCLSPIIEKTRYRVRFGGRVWEVDVFGGANAGLVVAEVELESETAEVNLPPWAGTEVSGDPRYYNANLVRHPFTAWKI
jgi:adenylate cyclase